MNEAVRPLNKQELDWNGTKENIVYVRAWALNWFNTGVKEQRTGSRVGFRPLIEAEVDEVRGQKTFGHMSRRVKLSFPALYRWKPN